MKNFIKENWFRILVVIILLMIYLRLGDIKEYTFNNWDTSDAKLTNIVSSIEETNSSINDLRVDLNNR